jgi:hypothetical protein
MGRVNIFNQYKLILAEEAVGGLIIEMGKYLPLTW